ncbi:MAG: hypothetical protein KDC12_09840 [Flavobacteriales bacterium]|nr:hypothetical protein [Flavobacteriales bacterium]
MMLLSVLQSCSTEDSTNNQNVVSSNSGIIENDVYTNDYFDFSLPIPVEWKVITLDGEVSEFELDNAEKDHLTSKGAVDVHSKTLLEMEKKVHPDSAGIRIVFLSEDRSGIKHGAREYLEYAQQLMRDMDGNSEVRYEFGSIKSQSTIGGKDFLAQPVFFWNQGIKQAQMTYCQEFKDYLLVVVLSGFVSKAELAEAKAVLSAVEWGD